jgi:hypothetical protein
MVGIAMPQRGLRSTMMGELIPGRFCAKSWHHMCKAAPRTLLSSSSFRMPISALTELLRRSETELRVLCWQPVCRHVSHGPHVLAPCDGQLTAVRR